MKSQEDKSKKKSQDKSKDQVTTPQLGAPVKHLLVDLDGTLLGNRNVPLGFDFVGRSLGALKKYGSFKNNVGALLEIYREFGKPSKDRTNDLRVVEIFARRMNMGIEEARKIIRESLATLFPELQKHFYPIPGSRDFLEWAKNHYPLTLATNPVWPPEIIEMRVKWAGIDPSIFGFVTHVRAMRAVKPHPEYFEEILGLQGLKAEDCLLIGDNVKMDLPATKVGIRVFIIESRAKRNALTLLKHPKALASAWKGSYSSLRTLLEAQLSNSENR
jgi:FMN phosphatase YigB (HAD superfamily)